jgi:hypothetical protein
VIRSSAADLHPATGGRFVFEREPGESPRYRVDVFLPEQAHIACVLDWDAGGIARLDPAPTDAWVLGEITKLARVLHRDPKARLVRWRG